MINPTDPMEKPAPEDASAADEKLIERLRKVQRIGAGWGLPILDGESLDVTCAQAADRIVELRAQHRRKDIQREFDLNAYRALLFRAEAAETAIKTPVNLAAPAMEKPADDPGSTHYDAVEANAICHPECAIAEIKRLRAATDQRAPTPALNSDGPTDGAAGRVSTHASAADADDLVTRLRDMAQKVDHQAGYDTLSGALYSQAADRIAELRHELRGSKSDHMATSRMHQHELARAEAAEAERDRLREEGAEWKSCRDVAADRLAELRAMLIGLQNAKDAWMDACGHAEAERDRLREELKQEREAYDRDY